MSYHNKKAANNPVTKARQENRGGDRVGDGSNLPRARSVKAFRDFVKKTGGINLDPYLTRGRY